MTGTAPPLPTDLVAATFTPMKSNRAIDLQRIAHEEGIEFVQKKNVIALVIMALLLLVLTSLAIISNPAAPLLTHLADRVEPLPASLQGSVGVYYHYYGWPDGISVMVIDQLSGKQLKPGESAHVWRSVSQPGASFSITDRGLFAGWERVSYMTKVQQDFGVAIQPSRELRDVDVQIAHQFISNDANFATMFVKGVHYEVTRDTVFLIEHQLDGTHEVKIIETDVSGLVSEVLEQYQELGVPAIDSPLIEELLTVDEKEKKHR